MRPGIWIGLLLCNIAWSINPSAAKVIIQELGPFHAAWLKYAVALSAYFLIVSVRAFRLFRAPDADFRYFLATRPRKDFLAAVAIGAATCFLSPMTQMFGLQASTAVNGSILVTFEPIFTVLFGWMILGERLSRTHYVSFILAIFGFTLLSRVGATFSVGIGDLILLVAVAGEAVYSVLARDLTRKYPGPRIFGTAMMVGVLLLSVVVLPWKGMPAFSELSLKGWVAVFWIGILGTTLPYLYWLQALSESLSLGSVVLSLFLQPLIGTLVAIFFLGEPFLFQQGMGGGLIVLAVTFQAMAENRQQRKNSAQLRKSAIQLP